MVKISEPLVIVGDIHGQYYDLLHVIRQGGDPGANTYLFLGDYVDRGLYGIECTILLMALKICYPSQVVLLRGNHESRTCSEVYGFRKEMLNKYDSDLFDWIMDVFDCLPLACVAQEKYFAMHGGISPDLNHLSDIDKIDRYKEPPMQGLMCDLLWADPVARNADEVDWT